MATRNVVLSTYAIPGDGNYNAITAITNDLSTKFVAGNIIYQSDLNNLRAAIGLLYIHDHSTNDEYASIGEFGNNGPRTEGPYTRTSTVPFSSGGTNLGGVSNSLPGSLQAGQPILATHHGFLKTNSDYLRGHYHQITDEIGS